MADRKNIGEQIRDAVQDAISSQDYSKLNDTVSRAIGDAAENVRRRKTFNDQWINQPGSLTVE